MTGKKSFEELTWKEAFSAEMSTKNVVYLKTHKIEYTIQRQERLIAYVLYAEMFMEKNNLTHKWHDYVPNFMELYYRYPNTEPYLLYSKMADIEKYVPQDNTDDNSTGVTRS